MKALLSSTGWRSMDFSLQSVGSHSRAPADFR
jgi:hypothetical protein